MGYQLWIEDEAKAEVRRLPGHLRQRIRRAIQGLSNEPRPPNSRELRGPEGIALEARRLRLDRCTGGHAAVADERAGLPPHPETGAHDRGSFGRLRTGSFGRLRTGSFGRLRTGSFARLRTGLAGSEQIETAHPSASLGAGLAGRSSTGRGGPCNCAIHWDGWPVTPQTMVLKERLDAAERPA